MTELIFKQLPAEIYDQMAPLRKQARLYREQYKFADAEVLLIQAWDLIPEPKFSWGDTDSYLYAVVDFYRRWGKHDVAKKWIGQALAQDLMPHEYSQYLEAGKTYYEAGESDQAEVYFGKVFKIIGARGFSGEDPKYLKFYREKQAAK